MNKKNSVFIIGYVFILFLSFYARSDEYVYQLSARENTHSKEERTPVHEHTISNQISTIVKNSSIEHLKSLIDSGLNINSVIDQVPLIFKFVVDDCRYELLEFAIKSGAHVNIREEVSGSFPIHWAVTHKNEKCFELLIENGADATVLDFEGRNAYFFALDFLNRQVLEDLYGLEVSIFTKNIYGIDVVHQSIISKQPNFFRQLLIQELTKGDRK